MPAILSRSKKPRQILNPTGLRVYAKRSSNDHNRLVTPVAIAGVIRIFPGPPAKIVVNLDRDHFADEMFEEFAEAYRVIRGPLTSFVCIQGKPSGSAMR
jgi:hypothetical protein